MKTTRKLNKKKLCMLIVAGAFLLLFAAYLITANYFNDRFLFGTIVNGKNVSGKTAEEVEQMIASEVDGYQIKIVPREGGEEYLTGDDVALKTVFDGTLQRQLAKQNVFAWPAALFRTSKVQVETMVDYNQKRLQEAAAKLEVMDKAQMREPLDAAISEYLDAEGYKILPEEQGTVVKEKKFLKALGAAILELKDSFSMEDAKCYKKPKYTKKSKELKKQAKTMNKYVGASITYDFGDGQEVLDGSTIHQWIAVDGQRNVSVSEEKIQEYVASLAEKYNTAGRAKSLNSSYGMEVTVSGGDYGWKIDQEQEAAALLENIRNGETLTKEPVYSQTANSRGGNDYGDTYVEVNLTAQHLFYYKDGALVVESDFVSGNEAKGWSTPAGAYGLYYKQRDKTLRGEDYATPVSFWMPFNGGVGFHDATWRNKFGGSYYIIAPAKLIPPGGVVEPHASVKWHPERYRRSVIFSTQRLVPLLIIQAVSACRGTPALGFISGHKVRLYHQGAVFIVKQMLGSQVHFYISIPIVIAPPAVCRLGINRLFRQGLPIADIFQKRRRLLLLVNFPSIVSAAYSHFHPIG